MRMMPIFQRLTVVVVVVWIMAVHALAVPATGTDGAHKQPDLDLDKYTFEQFLIDYNKSYPDPVEHARRHAIFATNMKMIREHNTAFGSGVLWSSYYQLGVNAFVDLEVHELPLGLDKTSKHVKNAAVAAAVQRHDNDGRTTANRAFHLRQSLAPTTLPEHGELPIIISPITELPASVDWHAVATPVKTQGHCGSCWAFASTAVLESHVRLATGKLFELSEQELVSCAPNERHCGGNGGCTGSTADIAFEFVRTHGVVEEWQFGYQSYSGEAINCSLSTVDENIDNNNATLYKDAIATISGWTCLPTNDYTVLMNVVAKLGPVAVSVAASPWRFYKSGIFTFAPDSSDQATDINHLVVLEGYGTDENGQDYWLVRNSWSPNWGEDGYIRLARNGISDESFCGVDTTPSHGDSCGKDDAGHDIVPPPVLVCGVSGILYDSCIPLGARLVVHGNEAEPSKAATARME